MQKRKKLFRNHVVDKKQLKQIMSWAFSEFGIIKSSYLANKLKDMGFQYATQAGLSISIEDLRVPPVKASQIKLAMEKASEAEFEVDQGKITEVERFQKVINTWNTTSEILKEQLVSYFQQTDPLNSIYMMAFSGARGNLSQVRQLVGMRGLMADPNGQIIDLPIVSNFREGLTVTDYIISSYGARKGLVDTALRTADSGYLTRRLIDVAQDVITREKNCKTQDGISLRKVMDGNNTLLCLGERIIGRILALPIQDPKTKRLIASKDQEITQGIAKAIQESKTSKVVVRSPLTCSSSRLVCQQCYGWNLAYGTLIDLGEAVGIIAAQSIGEPGTQLTMRTFHTGGVFTTEPSRQICAQLSGQILFSKMLKVQKTRTPYGEIAFRSENKSSISLITYENKTIKIEVLPETLILISDKANVKKNDVLFELASTSRQTGGEKAYKNVSIRFSGEVTLEKEKLGQDKEKESSIFQQEMCLVWVLAGQVYSVPSNSVLRIRKGMQLRRNQMLAEARLISTTGGIVKHIPNKEDVSILHHSNGLKGLNVYFESSNKKTQRSVIYGSKNRKIHINSLSFSKNLDDDTPSVGSLINLNYQTKTGGSLYSKGFKKKKTFSPEASSQFKIGGSIFYIPESTYQVNKDTTQIYVKEGDKIKIGTEVFKDSFSCIGGVVEIHELKKIVKQIKIRPSQSFLILKEKGFKNYHQKLVYPGEVLFEKIKISQLGFTEIKTIHGQTFLRVYPVIRYEILNDLNELSYFTKKDSILHEDIQIGDPETCFLFEKKIKANTPLQLIKRSVLCQPTAASKTFVLQLDFHSKLSFTKKLKLRLLILEIINITQYLPIELKKMDVKISTIVDTNQYIEPYTKMSSFQVLISQKNKILKIKEQFLGKERKIYLSTEEDFQKIFMEEATTLLRKNMFVSVKEKTKTKFGLKTAGLISKRLGSAFLLQKGQAYLFSQGATIQRRPGDLVKKGEHLGQLVYERARTGDIVQGLPRVEEILEGRKPKAEASIIGQPGIVTEILMDKSLKLSISVSIASSCLPQKYILKDSRRLLIGRFEFIHVGQPLNDASINPHTILETYFLYYSGLSIKEKSRQREIFTKYQSAYRSLRKIQALLLNSVQAVYYSQGVNISDKHVEIIIKQMTTKVQITESGGSNLLLDEFIDLRQVYFINKSLKEKESVSFHPRLFGITKASLKTKSFISAASFQHTTRVLTEAAIQGKTDWLRGLKENVIVGRLIPAGTGFNAYTDISYICVKVPAVLDKTSSDPLTSSQTKTKKYNQLKGKIKFKIG